MPNATPGFPAFYSTPFFKINTQKGVVYWVHRRMEKAPTKKRNRMRDVGNKVRNVNKAMHNAPSAQKAPQGSSATTASPAIAEPPPAVKTEADAEPSDTSPAAGVATSPNPIAEMPPAAPAQTEGGSLHSPHLTVSSRKSFEFGEEETAQREELMYAFFNCVFNILGQ